MNETTTSKKQPPKTAARWVERWRYWISPKPVLKGVFRVREGGCLARMRVKDHRGEQRLIFKVLDKATPDEARAWLVTEVERIKTGQTVRTTPTFSAFATSLAERKVMVGKVKSAHGRIVLTSILIKHLLPVFGGLRIDKIRRADVMAWRDEVCVRIKNDEVSPHTANGWWSVLRSTINAAVAEFELDRNPIKGLEPFDVSEHPAHTHEDPNSLTADEAAKFLARMREKYPQHFAMTVLGFATGLRPSSLRPLRRHGEQADVLWEEKALLVRRSQTRGEEVMNCTKTGGRQRIGLPDELVEVLRAHVDRLPVGPMLDSDLLFPSEVGGFRANSVLDKPFKAVAKAIGLRKRITPKGMRRTFQDLTRFAKVEAFVARSISGHLTEEMQEHYSTPWESEQREGLAKVLYLTRVATRPEPDPTPTKEATG